MLPFFGSDINIWCTCSINHSMAPEESSDDVSLFESSDASVLVRLNDEDDMESKVVLALDGDECE